jgi:hypothetical protein
VDDITIDTRNILVIITIDNLKYVHAGRTREIAPISDSLKHNFNDSNEISRFTKQTCNINQHWQRT